jgi:hypothetical protein
MGRTPVSRSQRGRDSRPVLNRKWVAVPAVATLMLSAAHWCMARQDQPGGANVQQPPKANPYHKPEDDARPEAVPPYKLDQTLKTVPVPRDRAMFNVQMVDASLLPRDKKGIWVLDFAFKPLRIRTVDVPGKGRRQVFYLYYKVVNRTGAPRMFAPQFVMVNESQERLEDEVIPEAVPIIQSREDKSIPLHGAVDVIGMIPPSTKPNVDDAVFGVACWDRWDPKSDRFSIFVRGLSDGFVQVPGQDGGKPVAKYKTLRIDFIRHGDERNLNENEIQHADPPYQWVYW